MAKFHRFVDPSYFLFPGESFPAAPGGTGTIGPHTYDRANVVSGGVGASGSANADAQVPSGPNQYTYFVAFGNDATSLNTNRGFRAVFESLDIIDDVLRESLPQRARQTGGSPAANGIQITGDVWCGDAGGDPEEELVTAATSAGKPLYNGTTPVVVTDIDDGTPGSSVVGTGWVTNPTVRFNVNVVEAYELFYGGRNTYARVAEQEQDAWFRPVMDLMSYAVTNRGVFDHGLDEMYRRSSARTVASPAVNTPGSGGTITRDGQALTVQYPWGDHGSGVQSDPSFSAFFVRPESFVDGGSFESRRSGETAYMAWASDRNTTSVDELTGEGYMRAAFSSMIPRDIRSATLDGPTRTYIQVGTTAVINPGGAGTSLLRLDGPWYAKNAQGTAIWSGSDVILLDFGGGDIRGYTMEVNNADPDTDVQLRSIGTTTGIASVGSDVAVTVVAWLSAYLDVGGTSSEGPLSIHAPRSLGDSDGGTGANANRGIQYRYNTNGSTLFEFTESFADDAADNNDGSVSRFYMNQQGKLGTRETQFSDFQTDLGIVNDGNPHTRAAGHMRYAFAHRYLYHETAVNESYRFDPKGDVFNPYASVAGSGFGALHIALTGTNDDPITIEVIGVNLSDQVGGWGEILIENRTGMDLTLTWPSQAKFSDPEDAVPGPAFTQAGKAMHFRVQVMGNSGDVWLMSRTDYDL